MAKWFTFTIISSAMWWFSLPYLVSATFWIWNVMGSTWHWLWGFKLFQGAIYASTAVEVALIIYLVLATFWIWDVIGSGLHWLWGFKLFQGAVYASTAVKVALIIYLVQKHHRYVKSLERKVEELESMIKTLNRQFGEARYEQGRLLTQYRGISAGLEAIRRRTENSTNRMHSKAAGGILVELETVREAHPFNHKAFEDEHFCEQWEKIFKAKEEIKFQAWRGPHAMN